MEETFVGMLAGFGVMTLVYTPFFIYSRIKCRQNIEEAENFYLLGEFGKAYNLVYPLLIEGRTRHLSISREVKKRALELDKKIKGDLFSMIKKETNEVLENLLEESELEIDLIRGVCLIPSKELDLSKISPTYRKYFEY